MASLNIVVIGTVNLDTLILPDGKVRQSFGGILYNILSLANLLPSESTIIPVCRVGEAHHVTILSLCKPFPNIRWDQIRKDSSGTNENVITYTSSSTRVEKLTRRVPSLSIPDIQPFLGANAILVNFISGVDVSLETLKYIKAHKTGLLAVDVQSLSLDLKEDGTKFLRPIPQWREWLNHIDITKLNENEIKSLSEDTDLAKEPYIQTALKLIHLGVSVVLITLGPEGSQVIYRDRDKAVYFYASPSVPVDKVVDPTGCGDVFLSAFVAYYVKDPNVLRANLFAHAAASFNARKTGLAGVYDLGNTDRLMKKVYQKELKRIEEGYKGEIMKDES
jgi:adenosine kinase